jgi:tetratricopeptide (TPR) repeat protein
VLAFLIAVAIPGIYLLLALHFPVLYILGTYEDLFGEWLQFYLFAAAALLSLRVLLSSSSYRVFFALLALFCFYVAMEEISWGQRIFGWSSPEFFRARNIQGETNLHNILVGPVRTAFKSAVEYLLAAALMLYGVVYPLLRARKSRAALWLEGKGLPAPPLSLSPCFAVAAFLELGLFLFNEAEVAEILLGFAVTALAARHSPPARGPSALAVLAFTAASVVALATGTTYALSSSPAARARIESRVERGVEKFASRYARAGRWHTAEDLYERLAEARPSSSSARRNLAEAYRKTGDAEAFRRSAEEALALDLERVRKKPRNAAVNRSLARSYRLLGEEEKFEEHAKRALQTALEKAGKNPGSAAAAYSLARSYRLNGNHAEALVEYRRAHRLDPGSRKYRKAYFAARKRVPQ